MTADGRGTMATLQEALLIAFDLQREGRFSRSRRPSATISPTPTRSAATRRRRWSRRGRGRFPQPRWSGQPLGGGRLFVWGEQGVGDELMFATLLPLLTQSSTYKTQSSTRALEGCLLECDARLRALFR
ncbi:hypothetical protein D3867_11460 [Azospirillum argentinense]|uniref:Uncharacterized protein n=2 Tax=Azospirillum TaxID=191 RepID=A0A4D8PXI6_AZOBR|nr:hypothetical protein D3867_11460 [Azospirillum argentinense]